MKKAKIAKVVATLLALSFIVTITGCSSDDRAVADRENQSHESETARNDTPSRRGAGGFLSASLVSYTFDEAVEDADLIVDVTITEWLREYTGNDGLATHFAASVNRTFKSSGGEYENIVIAQAGNSEMTFENDPLFRNGERLLLFLTEFESDEATDTSTECNKIFGLVGMYQTPLLVQEHESETVVLSRFDWGIAQCLVHDKAVESPSESIQNEIVMNYLEYDPVFKELEHSLSFAFDYGDVVERVLVA
jgi:hypothetical protein